VPRSPTSYSQAEMASNRPKTYGWAEMFYGK
jgi:hypothetical protein